MANHIGKCGRQTLRKSSRVEDPNNARMVQAGQ